MLKQFSFTQKHNIRVVGTPEEPWFVAGDVCNAINHSNTSVALRSLDDDEKGVRNVYTPGGRQEMTVINEAGLYSLIMRSNKPEAKRFKRWVTHEVLPEIRKNGYYSTDPMRDTVRNIMSEVLAERMDGTLDLSTAAKALHIYPRDFFRELRELGVLMDNNVPYQKWINKGYFAVRCATNKSSDLLPDNVQARITGRGIVWLQEEIIPYSESWRYSYALGARNICVATGYLKA